MAVLVLLVVLLALPGVSPNVGSRADAPARSTVGLPHSMGAALAHPGTSLPVHLAARIHPAGGSGKIWTNLTAASPITPTSREEFALASDPAANITLFFGGFSTNNNGGVIYPLLNDTWEFANGAWKDITGTAGTAPSPRLGPQMVYDSADGYFLLWGGLNYTKGAGYYLTDTWKFTPGTGTWTNITSSVNTPPTGLYIPTMAYDVKDKEAVLFGGSVGGTGVNGKGAKPFQETWTYSNLVWTNLTATLGAGQPPARYAAAMSWDGYDNEVVLYGGLKTAATFWADTWVFKANAWTDVTPVSQTATNNPAPVRGAMMASDLGSSGYALLFGGIDSNSTVRNETWVFYNQTWSNMTAYVGLPPPQPRVQYDGGAAYGAMAYDNQTQSVVLYGGFVIWSGGFNDGTENLTWGYKWSNISVVLTANRTQIPQNSGVTFTAVARGGTFNYSYVYANDTLGVTNALPAGCVSKNLPSITCFPSGTGFFNITVTATDTNSVTAKALDVAIHVFPPFTSMLSISKRAIDYNEKVTITTTYAGGTGKGLTFVYSGLPPGCSSGLASFTCVPKGVGAIGNFTISVKVTDSVADVAKSSGPVNLTVYPAFTLGLSGGPLGPAKKVQLDAGSTLYLNASGLGGNNAWYTAVWTGLPAGCLSSNVTTYTCVPSATLILNYTTLVLHVFLTDATNSTLNASLGVVLWPQLNANVNAVPLSGHSPLTVSFFANVTGGWQPTQSEWLTDAGRVLQPINTTFVFTYIDNGGPSANTHLIQFWANDTFNASIYGTETITVLPPVPLLGANITSNAPTGLSEIGQTAVFNVTATGGLGPFVYNWTAVSGCTASGVYFNCTPIQPGYVYAAVKVTDSLGKSYTPKAASVDFLPQLHVTTGYLAASTCGAGLVNLTAVPSGGKNPYVVTWTFPDGTTATGSAVSHTFATTGNFSLTVGVADFLGAHVTVTTYVLLPDCSGSTGTTSSSFPILAVVGVAIVVLAVLGLLGFLMMRRRGGGGDPSEDLGPETAAAAPAEGEEEGELWGADQRPPEEKSDMGGSKDVGSLPPADSGGESWPPAPP